MSIKSIDNAKLALNIGRTKRLLDQGLSAIEIAAKLNKPASSVRSWIKIIELAEENRKKESKK